MNSSLTWSTFIGYNFVIALNKIMIMWKYRFLNVIENNKSKEKKNERKRIELTWKEFNFSCKIKFRVCIPIWIVPFCSRTYIIRRSVCFNIKMTKGKCLLLLYYMYSDGKLLWHYEEKEKRMKKWKKKEWNNIIWYMCILILRKDSIQCYLYCRT